MMKQLHETSNILPPVVTEEEENLKGLHQKFKMISQDIKRESSQKVLK